MPIGSLLRFLCFLLLKIFWLGSYRLARIAQEVTEQTENFSAASQVTLASYTNRFLLRFLCFLLLKIFWLGSYRLARIAQG